MTLWVDDEVSIYVDGQHFTDHEGASVIETFTIPDDAKLLAFQAENWWSQAGLKVSLSNGLFSSDTMKCTGSTHNG